MSVNKSVLFLVRSTKVRFLCNKSSLIYAVSQRVYYDFKKYSTNTASNRKPDWNRAVSEAEKIVGYNTSFFSLRCLFSDKIANDSSLLRKLVDSNHPLFKTSESLNCNGRNVRAWGLITLLISKAAGHINVEDMEEDKSTGILCSQRSLADVTEMIHTSYLVHQGLVNIRPGVDPKQSELDDINFGNKIALLGGDYLLANSSAKLAALRNQDLVELMSSAARDLAEAEFVGRRDSQDNPLPSVPPADRTGYAVKEWTLKNVLSAGALLGKSCKAALKVAGHDEQMQRRGYDFGKHLVLAWQARLDLSPFLNKNRNNQFDVCSAPVMFHIEHDPSILMEINKGLESVRNIDYPRIYDIVVGGPAIELTMQLQRKHSRRAKLVLRVFRESDARTALFNIIAAMGDFGKTFAT